MYEQCIQLNSEIPYDRLYSDDLTNPSQKATY